jgi:formylglycine-generating enzyme required for sulfatase activity
MPLSIDPFLEAYFNAINEKISDAKLYAGDKNLPNKIHEIYVSLPINLQIDIRVASSKISHLRIAGDETWEPAEQTNFCSLLCKLNKLVSENIEYRYQNKSERPKILAPTYADGDKLNYWTLNGIDAISVFDSLLILGDPGQGKSTLSRFLATKLTEQYSNSNRVFSEYSISDTFDRGDYIPVFIELKDFVNWFKEKGVKTITSDTFFAYICYTLNPNKDFSTCNKQIFSEKCVYILDGLDEIDLDDHNKSLINQIIHTILSPQKSCKLIISCRERDYHFWNLSLLRTYKIELMDKFTANQLVQRIFDLQYAERESSKLHALLQNLGIEAALFGNPLFLSLIVQLYLKSPNNFPKTKSLILKESIKLLLNRKPHAIMSNESWDIEQVYRSLEEIAYKIQSSCSSDNYKISARDIAGIICFNHTWCNWNDFGNFLASATGIISNAGEELYEFTHRHFQEYLCASYLVNQKSPDEAMKEIKTGLITTKRVWGEVSLLYIELLYDANKITELWDLLNVLSNYATATEADTSWIAWYLGKIIEYRNYVIYNQYSKSDSTKALTISKIKSILLKTFSKKDSLPLKERVFCGKVLGILGDMRKGVNINEFGVPDIRWCHFGSMQHRIGVDEEYKTRVRKQMYRDTPWGMKAAFTREEPQLEISLPEFEISKYPVTVAQFHAFMVDAEGYFAVQNWAWSPLSEYWFHRFVQGKQLSEIIQGKAGKTNPPNYPITDVNWIEAVAFCEWLSKKTGSAIRLPTEGEWEAVAKSGGLIFTWGDEFEESKCNSCFSGIGDIAPVGTFLMYVEDNYPCELNGNVWEWCNSVYPSWDESLENLSVYDENNNYINSNNRKRLSLDTWISTRGGSYINPPVFLRSNFRGRDKISLSFYRQGFRIVRETSAQHPMSSSKNGSSGEATEDKNYFKAGSGATVMRGDRIRISYIVKQGSEIIEDMMSPELNFEIVLGSGQIHKIIDEFILSHDPCISTNFEQDFKIYSGQSDNTAVTYTFYVLIQDKR